MATAGSRLAALEKKLHEAQVFIPEGSESPLGPAAKQPMPIDSADALVAMAAEQASGCIIGLHPAWGHPTSSRGTRALAWAEEPEALQSAARRCTSMLDERRETC